MLIPSWVFLFGGCKIFLSCSMCYFVVLTASCSKQFSSFSTVNEINSNKGGKNPSDENPFLVGLETSIERRGTANIMLHIPQSIDLFVVYSLECILTSSEAIVGKRLFVWLIFSCLWSTRHVFLIIKHKSTHFYFPSHQWITIWRYLAHKEEWKVPVVLKFHKSWPWRFGICFSADHWVW